MLESIKIYINGRIYSSQKHLNISRSLGVIYGILKFKIVEDPSFQINSWIIGSEIKVFTGDQLIFDGILYKYESSLNSNNSSVLVTCYDKPYVLHKSSPDRKNTQYKDFNLNSFVNGMVSPFDVKYLIIGPDDEIITYDEIELLSTVEKELKNGLLSVQSAAITSSKDGSFKIITSEQYEDAGTIKFPKAIKFKIDETGRFNTYETVRQSSKTSDIFSSIDPNQQISSIKDDQVDDKSIKRVVSPGNSDLEYNNNYVQWMKNTAYGFSRTVQLSVLGWRDNFDLDLYSPGKTIILDGPSSEKLGCSGEWLINSVNLSLSLDANDTVTNGGTVTSMELVKKEIYSSKPKFLAEETSSLGFGF